MVLLSVGYHISFRWESNAVFCNKIVMLLYCVHASIVALADLKASTPVTVVVKEKQNHFFFTVHVMTLTEISRKLCELPVV